MTVTYYLPFSVAYLWPGYVSSTYTLPDIAMMLNSRNAVRRHPNMTELTEQDHVMNARDMFANGEHYFIDI